MEARRVSCRAMSLLLWRLRTSCLTENCKSRDVMDGTEKSATMRSLLNMATKLTKAFAEFVCGRCIGGIQKRVKRLLSADFAAEID